MNIVKVYSIFLLILGFSQLGNSQCNNCDPINLNGDFETQNNILGTEAAIGISTGEISNWYASHGTADYFSADWNWYYEDGIENLAGHICYGNRPAHDHSEGIFTKVEIKGDDQLEYCLELDLATFCDSEKYGKVHIYLANNLVAEGPQGFSFPTPESNPDWFENSLFLDVITLDESTYFEPQNLSKFTIPFTADQDYTQLWLFTEYLYNDDIFTNCGVMIDNVKLTAKTNAIEEISYEELEENVFSFNAESLEDNLSYYWDFGNGITSTEANPTIEYTEGLYELSLVIVDENGACAVLDTQINVGDQEFVETCNYEMCLDASGIPTLASIELVLPTGESLTINNETQGFAFPYCIGTPSMCSSREHELEFLVLDINNWLMKSGLKGKAYSFNDVTDESCRGEKIVIENTEVEFSFSKFNYEDNPGDEDQVFFERMNCVQKLHERNNSQNIEIEAYPNPTTDFLNITTINSESVELSVLSSQGEVLIKSLKENGEKSLAVSVEHLNPGIYYVHAKSKNSTNIKRIIKL